MVQHLRELSPVEIRELVLPKSVKTLYTTIKAEQGNEVPQALIIASALALTVRRLPLQVETIPSNSGTARANFFTP
jgi:hypothetical protein